MGHAFSFFYSTCDSRRTSRVAFRMFSAPLPGATHDGLELRKLRLPVQVTLDAVRRRYQHCRIAGAPRHLARGNRMTGYASSGFDDFANAKAVTGAEIVDELVALAQRVEYEDVRAGEIAHVNVIADAGAVRRGIVRAKDGYVLAFSQRD